MECVCGRGVDRGREEDSVRACVYFNQIGNVFNLNASKRLRICIS